MRFWKRKLHFVFLSFYVGEIGTEKRKTKWKRQKKPIKIWFVLRWSSKNVKNRKKLDFSKH